jgi:hypothetical protein
VQLEVGGVDAAAEVGQHRRERAQQRTVDDGAAAFGVDRGERDRAGARADRGPADDDVAPEIESQLVDRGLLEASVGWFLEVGREK